MAETSLAKSRPSVPYGANLLNFRPIRIFGVVEAGHFEFVVLTDTEEYE